MGTREEQFSATIYKLGINPCVEVPIRVSRAFAKRGYIPVAGNLNRKPFLANLVPAGEGRHRLFINWFEIPVALLLAVVVNGMEVPGMVHAFGRRELPKTAYR